MKELTVQLRLLAFSEVLSISDDNRKHLKQQELILHPNNIGFVPVFLLIYVFKFTVGALLYGKIGSNLVAQ